MYKYALCVGVVFFGLLPVFAQPVVTVPCEDILLKLETGELSDRTFYDKCGFNDETVVWNKWAGYISEKQMKKALFEICERFPLHTYHELYCQKSAQLGYGPAIAKLGEFSFKKNDIDKGMKYFIHALETKELSEEQEGKVLEILGIYYFTNKDEKTRLYLAKAALKRSALANNIIGYIIFSESDQNERDQRETFEHLWRAILLGCPSAEENLGLFQLNRLQKITKDLAVKQMSKNIYSCTPVVETPENKAVSKEMFSCRCKTALENEERFASKPYLLMKITGKTALLKMKNGKEFSVSEKENLPDGSRVAEIRKTALILNYPKEQRVVLNLYTPDKCVQFCIDSQITENFSPQGMQKKIEGGVGVKIEPYHLSFNKQECETIDYYAPLLVDINQAYVGKNECAAFNGKVPDPILDKLNDSPEMLDQAYQKAEQEQEPASISKREKQKLRLIGEQIIGD